MHVVVRAISILGGPAGRTAAVIGGCIFLLLKSQRREAALLATAVGGAGAVNSLAKAVVARRRPPRSRSDGGSFPSGHASGSVALAGTALVLIWPAAQGRILRAGLTAAGAAFAAAIGYSRVSLREHYVGDVLGGYALGAGWLALLLRYFPRSPADRPE